tara:strand:+ start:2585 stop:2872 length:288 start_codon:yes stop_codon:yes gene_type:complete
MLDVFEEERVVVPFTLINCNGKIESFGLYKADDVKKVSNAGGVIFEDWETAKKVAFGLTSESGVTLRVPKGFSAPVFAPNSIPEWATVIEGIPND